MHQIRKNLFSAAVIAIALCGCAPRDNFSLVADNLDYGSEYFSVTLLPTTANRFENIFRNFEVGIAQSTNDGETRKSLNLLLSNLELSWRTFGIHEVSAYGASSKPIAGNLFCNRIALLSDPGAEGVLWKTLLNSGQNDLAKFAKLPSEADFAIQLNLDLTSIRSVPLIKLIAIEAFIPDFISEIFAKEDLCDENFAQGISGTWQLAVFNEHQQLLTVPDRDGKLFERILKRASGNGFEINSSSDDAGVTINSSMLTLIPKNGYLKFFFGGEETKKLAENAKILADDPVFQASSTDFPESATGFFYVKDWKKLCSLCAYNISTGIYSFCDKPQTGFVVSKDDLLLLTGVSYDPLPAQYLVFCAGVAAKIAEGLEQESTPTPDNSSAVAPPSTEATAAALPDRHIGMLANVIYPVLTSYRDKHGKFPAEPKIGCISNIINDAALTASLPQEADHIIYFYLGDWGNLAAGEMPLLLEWIPSESVEHRFNVLFCDGSCDSFTATQESIRQYISILQTAKHYDEERFNEMMRRAAFLEVQINQMENSEK